MIAHEVESSLSRSRAMRRRMRAVSILPYIAASVALVTAASLGWGLLGSHALYVASRSRPVTASGEGFAAVSALALAASVASVLVCLWGSALRLLTASLVRIRDGSEVKGTASMMVSLLAILVALSRATAEQAGESGGENMAEKLFANAEELMQRMPRWQILFASAFEKTAVVVSQAAKIAQQMVGLKIALAAFFGISAFWLLGNQPLNAGFVTMFGAALALSVLSRTKRRGGKKGLSEPDEKR